MEVKEIIKNQIIKNETADLDALKKMYEIYSGAADLDEESSLGHEDFAKQDESRESARSLKIRINRAQHLLDTFKKLDFSKKTKVEPGALVKTDSLNFMIGIASAIFEYEGQNYIGLNTDAPIYQALQTAKTGDKIAFGREYQIVAIL
ncbi:MAG: hypothetical protein WCY89_03720 [Flavobacteriaceae bacterium]